MFNLNDGQFCHVLPDRLVIYPKMQILEMPQPRDGANVALQILYGSLSVIPGAMTVVFFIVGFYPLAAMTLLTSMAATVAFMRGNKYSATNCIMRDSIVDMKYRRVNFGFDYFEVRYRGKNQKEYLRRISIYDSDEIAAKAVNLMISEGLLKPEELSAGSAATK